MNGYKIVYVRGDGSLASATSYYRVDYAVGVPTLQPEKAGPLCVFTALPAALVFCIRVCGRLHSRIYQCEYILSSTEFIWAPSNRFGVPLSDLPEKTALATSVTLKEQVYENNL